MLLDQAQIQSLIPHAGAMCLLEGVNAWGPDAIACVSWTHRDPANPLRRQGRLAALYAFEYGAQAAAVHGALCAQAIGQIAPAGYLAALRDACWFITDLATVTAPLEIVARLLGGEAGRCIYAVQISAAGQTLAKARITIAPQLKNEVCA